MAEDLVCPRCSIIATRICQGCGYDLVTGEPAGARDPTKEATAGDADESVPLFVPTRVLEEGEREARRRVLRTIARNAKAALPTTAIACALAGVALDRAVVPMLGEGADFSSAVRLVTTFILALTLVEHTRSAAEDAAAPLFATSGPFDPAALPRSLMLAVPTAGVLGAWVLLGARTLEMPFLFAPIAAPVVLLGVVLAPALSALVVVGEGFGAFSPRKLAEVILELGGVYWEAARYLAFGLSTSLALVWIVPGPGLLRGPLAVLAMAVAGAAIGSLARAVSGEALEDPEAVRERLRKKIEQERAEKARRKAEEEARGA